MWVIKDEDVREMDKLIKSLCLDHKVRVIVVDTTDLCEEARKRHDLWPTAAAALGRVMSMGAIMGSLQKNAQEKVTLQINGGGPLGTILVDGYCDGRVRGFVGDPHVHYTYNDTGKLAVGVAVGKEGYLKVIKDLGMRDDFEGTVALQTGEIGEDFAYYFAVSEQTPSVVSLGVLVDTDNSVIAAGGMLIQMLPGASEEDIQKVEAIVKELKPMSSLIHEGLSVEDILKKYFEDADILYEMPVHFSCSCSKENMERALMTLSEDERKAMIEEDHGCEITCHWCNEHYQFTEDELRSIDEAAKKEKAHVENTRTLH